MVSVSLMNGLSEKVSDDGGNKLRVPSGEPFRVKTAGHSVVANVHANQPCELQSSG